MAYNLRQRVEKNLMGRRNLKKVSFLPVSRLAQVDLSDLCRMGIRGIILDLDNTIVSEDDRYLSPEAEVWIQSALQNGMALFILSNGKRRYRVDYWADRLKVPALSPARKPFPTGFRRALKVMGCRPHQTVVIGDSLHTDVIGAWLAGCTAIQVASLPHPPRWWERIAGRWLQRAYQSSEELWPFDGSLYHQISVD
ncbi:MAG: YqeG family HAD IIIA-type phosphatase [Spirulina sp.]